MMQMQRSAMAGRVLPRQGFMVPSAPSRLRMTSAYRLPTQFHGLKPARAIGDHLESDGTLPPSPKTEPPESVMARFRSADAVCFDVDCTITLNDSLDLLAEFMGVAEQVVNLTSKDELEKKLDIINCTPPDIKRFLDAYPPASRLTPGILTLMRALQSRGIHIFLISGGFRELILPIAQFLGIPKANVFANRMSWQFDDETGEATKLLGFDLSMLAAQEEMKPKAIDFIRDQYPYENIVMIGDGITDLEAVTSGSGGADLFIGYGGVAVDPTVAAQAEWFIYDWPTLTANMRRYKVAMIGSGAWACAAVRMAAQTTRQDDPANEFQEEVILWVNEEMKDGKLVRGGYKGRKLTEIINETHENPKYLPGVDLGYNVKAIPNLLEAVKDADCIILCAPHQFLHGICKSIAGKTKPGAMAISLTKGMRVRKDGPQLISAMVNRILGADCSVLMGANIALDIATEGMSEAVIGYSNKGSAKVWQKLFTRPYFEVDMVADAEGAEMCGTLKNVVAIAAGMSDGLGASSNSKAALLRQGLTEMRKFSQALFPTVREQTFFMGCGIGDLLATCYGGRNRKVAEAWTQMQVAGNPASFADLERDLLQGQKLQGILTSNEVQEVIQAQGWERDYPLFTTINRIANNKLPVSWVFRFREGATSAYADSSATEMMDKYDTGIESGVMPKRKPKAKAVPVAA